MPTKLTTQECEEAKQVYWELTGKNLYKEPTPAQKTMAVHNALQKYLKMKEAQVKIFT